MMNKNDLRYANFQIKSFKPDENNNLTIEAYAAVFNNIDSYGDIIRPGAFTKTIADRGGRIAFCYQHDIFNPIGKILSISEDQYGLVVSVMISAAEQEIQTKIKEGILSELSIGYCTIASTASVVNGEDVNELTEIKLIEISVVTIAANPLALITSMKSEERRNALLEDFDRVIALSNSNYKLKFELMKLKSVYEAGTRPSENTKTDTEPQVLEKMDVAEIANILGVTPCENEKDVIDDIIGSLDPDEMID